MVKDCWLIIILRAGFLGPSKDYVGLCEFLSSPLYEELIIFVLVGVEFRYVLSERILHCLTMQSISRIAKQSKLVIIMAESYPSFGWHTCTCSLLCF